MRNNGCLFEKLFKIMKNGVFVFRIFNFVSRILTFLCYENEEVMTSLVLKAVKRRIKNISRNVGAVLTIFIDGLHNRTET